MARKSRRRQQNRPRPRPQPGQTAAQPQAPAQPQGAPAAQRQVGGDQALVRAVEMSLAPQTAGTARRNRGGIVLESGDAAIPLDRVPYFTGDLKRLGVTAVLMIVVLVLAALLVIPQVVK